MRRLLRWGLLRWGLCLALAAALLAPLRPARAAVTLAYFTLIAGDGQVDVTWGTATELNTLAFRVQRSMQEDGTYQNITELIFALGDQLTGADYEFLDTNVTNGETYWYRLVELDTGYHETYHPAVSAIPGGTPTPTATPTRTPSATHILPTTGQITLTPTRTTAITAAPTPTRTPTPYASPTTAGYFGPTSPAPVATLVTPLFGTSTPISGQPVASTTPGLTLTESPGAAPVFTGTITESATLIPLPSLTLIFPTQGPAALAQAPTDAPARPDAPSQTPQRLLPLALIGLIWLILASWWIYTLRKHN